MKKQSKYLSLIILTIFCCFISCKKYLDEKPLKQLTLPETLTDLQALLDNYSIMNLSNSSMAEMVADNYYVTENSFKSVLNIRPDVALNYNWSVDATPVDNGWNVSYQGPIYYSNVVLDYLPNITAIAENQVDYNNVKGSSLFFRAFAFYNIAQLYCKLYSSTASNDPGIVLRMTSDINAKSSRATVQQTYQRIIDDLKVAAELLPVNTGVPSRPTKAAAYGALARVYLGMREYESAGEYANLCLAQKSSLIDFNDLIPLKTPPVGIFNSEVIFHSVCQGLSILSSQHAKVDSNLLQSYALNDLRRSVFFRANTGVNLGTFSFQGSYNGGEGQSTIFNGLTTAEMFLIRAECYARKGNTELALADLNTLMKKRWNKNVPYPIITAVDSEDARNKILTERRKELVFRGQRWSDLRRLNLEGANITLKRVIGGTTYTLPPNDPRWVMLIPNDVINRAGITQNPR